MIDLVFDRTQDDVNYAQSLLAKGYQNFTEDEKTLWDLGNLKGAYNISDMNRVNQAFSILLEQLTESGTIVTGYTEQPTWTDEDYITKDVLNIYIENLRVLRSYIPTMDDTPDNPSDVTAKMFNYVVANNIEKIIERCMLSLDYITSPLYYPASGNPNVISGSGRFLWRAEKCNSKYINLHFNETMRPVHFGGYKIGQFADSISTEFKTPLMANISETFAPVLISGQFNIKSFADLMEYEVEGGLPYGEGFDVLQPVQLRTSFTIGTFTQSVTAGTGTPTVSQISQALQPVQLRTSFTIGTLSETATAELND